MDGYGDIWVGTGLIARGLLAGHEQAFCRESPCIS